MAWLSAAGSTSEEVSVVRLRHRATWQGFHYFLDSKNDVLYFVLMWHFLRRTNFLTPLLTPLLLSLQSRLGECTIASRDY
jgi:hypothetical protein